MQKYKIDYWPSCDNWDFFRVSENIFQEIDIFGPSVCNLRTHVIARVRMTNCSQMYLHKIKHDLSIVSNLILFNPHWYYESTYKNKKTRNMEMNERIKKINTVYLNAHFLTMNDDIRNDLLLVSFAICKLLHSTRSILILWT